MIREVKIIGAGIGDTGRVSGGKEAPKILKKNFCPSAQISWEKTIYRKGEVQGKEAFNDVVEFSLELAKATQEICKRREIPLVLGGDHTCAIGTWSGISSSTTQDIGLLWIDAHLDGHTLETSHSGNIHGMPLASLLGQGDRKIAEILSSKAKLKPENVVIIGARDYEKEEFDLLKKLGVKIYENKEVLERGTIAVFKEASSFIQEKTCAYGVSFDLDVLDPKEAPAVGTPVKNGLDLKETLKALSYLDKSLLLGAEIAEFNPSLPESEKCEKIVWQVSKALFE